ncbi:MAG: hypothetical protein HC880_18950 [Bacteroidia bacterium]|nr:hypothetical protein [Bacteroidia bacterium]
MQNNALTLEINGFDLTDLLQYTRQSFLSDHEQARLSVALTMIDNLPRYVKGDAGRLHQTLTLLLSLMGAASQSGKISMVVRTEDHQEQTLLLSFELGDALAEGSPPKWRTYLAENARATAQAFERTLTQKLVNLLEGKLVQIPRNGVPKRLVLTLPFTEATPPGEGGGGYSPAKPGPDIKPSAKATLASTPEPSAPSLPQLRVLYIDGVEANLGLIRALSHNMNVQLLVSSQTQAFRQKVQAQRYDMILVEMHPPQWRGLDIMQQIRQMTDDIYFQQVALVAVSAAPGDIEPERMAALNIRACLPRPVNPIRLRNLFIEQAQQKDFAAKSPLSPEASEAQSLEFETFDDVFGDNPAGYLEFLSITYAEYIRRKEDMIRSLQSRDQGQLSQVVHRSLSVVKSLNDQAFTAFLQSLPQTSSLSEEQLAQLIGEVGNHFDRFLQAISRKLRSLQ